MHGEFWRVFFLQAHRETEAHFSLVHTSLGSSYLIAHVLHYPPPPRAQLCNRSCSNKHTHFTATGMFSQRNKSDSFRYERAAFYQSLESKVALAAAKAAALRINLNVESCGVVAPPMQASSRAPLLIPLLLSHNLPFLRVHQCVMGRLVHTGLGSSSLVAHVLHYPPPPTRTAL